MVVERADFVPSGLQRDQHLLLLKALPGGEHSSGGDVGEVNSVLPHSNAPDRSRLKRMGSRSWRAMYAAVLHQGQGECVVPVHRARAQPQQVVLVAVLVDFGLPRAPAENPARRS